MPEKYTNEEVANIVDQEGLDYAITGYMSADLIADEKLAALWRQAREVLTEIERMLETD